MDKFGHTINSKGYKVLPGYLRVIQGDGMDIDSIPRLLQNMVDVGISTSNIAMGMGGGLLQKVDRDTCSYAMKANAVEISGKWRDVNKDPITDSGKTSKRGRQAVVYHAERGYEAMPLAQLHSMGLPPQANQLQEVYRDGELLIDQSFKDIRERASI